MAFRIALVVLALISFSCSQKDINQVGRTSTKTGVNYGEAIQMSDNITDDNAFTVPTFIEQETAPGLVFVEGGQFIFGGSEKDISYENDNFTRQVTVNSFYMDETEVSNTDYKEFLHYINVLTQRADSVLALYPDTTVWFRDLAYNDPYVQYYYWHPGFANYPVVGINWHQAQEYCKWRSEAVNGHRRKLDGDTYIDFPSYRLPTEAEWEYAARGGLEQELYPWIGKTLREVEGRYAGKFRANFKRGRGDYAGRSNKGGSNLIEGLNDAYMIPAPVRAFYPNDFGLYNMSGNVAEWTADTYRKMASEDVEDLNPFRRRGSISIPTVFNLQSDTFNIYTSEAYTKENSLLFNPDPNKASTSDDAKVYRGGSWADVAYYLSCGTRRFWYKDSASAMIGFRSAMFRVGSPF
jgi:formylglycine-generating enzyme